MCGIAGKIDFSGAPIDRDWLARAGEGLAHRGPDASRLYTGSGGGATVGLVHRRLRVIDLAELADQPLWTEQCASGRRLGIVFNGEIYNYQELRAGLIERGHRLRSKSDTEVILHLYEEEGPRSVERLSGMFAFAIWDADAGELFAARDRVGKKPLYYRSDGHRFWFASEPRAILADPDVPADVNGAAVASYLRLGFIPGPQSAFAGLLRLPPAHSLRVTRTGCVVRRYWSLSFQPKLDVTEQDAVNELESRLDAAVQARMVSDVPLGAFLSGGLDSSTVTALMTRHAPGRVKTFSIGFEDSAYNELPAAREVAAALNTDHHEFIVRPQAADLVPALAWHYGEPFADSSALPMYYLAELARRHITVALNGDGGDENLGGYRRYALLGLVQGLASLPAPFHAVARKVSAMRVANTRSWSYDMQRLVRGVGRDPWDQYRSWFGFFGGDQERWLAPASEAAEATSETTAAALLTDLSIAGPADRAMASDIALYLPDDLLVKADIATMAHGLEARSPLLDYQLMEWVARLPVRLKRRGRTGKYLLRRVAARVLPKEVLRRPKLGFGVPLDSWFRGPLDDLMNELLLSRDARTTRWMRPGAAAELLAEHRGGTCTHGHRLWALLMLEVWLRQAESRPSMTAPVRLQLS